MPRVAMDFSKTVIYHFVCKDEMIKCSYVGSTTNFVRRKATHKSSCNKETSIGHHLKVYQTIRANGGWTNWSMIPIEEYPCENNTQQIIREQYWIDKLKPEMNCKIAYREGETASEKNKSYYVLNAEVIKEKSKAYRLSNAEKNAEKNAEYQKAYREANSKVIAEKKKAWCEANSVVVAQKKKAWYEAKKIKKEQETEQ